MADVNTVTLSGKLRGAVESQDTEKLAVSRFYLMPDGRLARRIPIVP